MLYLTHQNIAVRTAQAVDAPLLVRWWNDGAVMAHAGFPNGLGTTVAREAPRLTGGRLIIEEDGRPIGECSFRPAGNRSAEIGIKICEPDCRNRGVGRIVLSLLIRRLFDDGYAKIVLDTNLNNLRAQHVYESLGFCKLRVNVDSWRDQLGRLQSAVDYELTEADFVDFTKKN